MEDPYSKVKLKGWNPGSGKNLGGEGGGHNTKASYNIVWKKVGSGGLRRRVGEWVFKKATVDLEGGGWDCKNG